MPDMPDTDPDSILSALKPRHKPSPAEIDALLADMKTALQGAASLDYYNRMQLNHDARAAWWEGQHDDGRKWSSRPSEGARRSGQNSDEVFPWPGASDKRVRMVDVVVREHNDFKRFALARRQKRMGARNLSPDVDVEARAALWNQTDQYYEDSTRRAWNTAAAQWSDIAEELGHAVMFVGWTYDQRTVKRTMSVEKVQAAVMQSAAEMQQEQLNRQHAEAGGAPEDAPQLSAEDVTLIEDQAWKFLEELMIDDRQRKVFASALMATDPQMPMDEAVRLTRDLKKNSEAQYYAVEQVNPRPEFRALTPFVDVFYPPTTTRLDKAAWIVWAEWVTPSELRARADGPRPYEAKWVEGVIAKPGRGIEISGLADVSKFDWVMSNAGIRSGVKTDPNDKLNTLHQILHVYYQASAIGGVPALYHTVVSAHVPGAYGYHECCEHAHGNYSFIETMTETTAPYLLASRGVGERSLTDQKTVKIHSDLQDDSASLKINPPLKIPVNQEMPKIAPNSRIRVRSAAGMGVVEKLDIGGDAKESQMTIELARDLFNEYWARGPKVDPEAKMAKRQMIVSDFLRDVEAVKEQAFQLIQEYAPKKLRASFVGGLPVSLDVTQEEIQGQIAIELDYDVGEMDNEALTNRMKNVGMLLQFNNQNLLKSDAILRALASWVLPSHFKTLIANPDKQAKDETEDERRINTEIISGTQTEEEASYVIGTDHARRLDFMKKLYGVEVTDDGEIMRQWPAGKDGQPTRPQKLMAEDPDVQARVLNRLRFHARQMTQQQNAITGKTQVQNVTEPTDS